MFMQFGGSGSSCEVEEDKAGRAENKADSQTTTLTNVFMCDFYTRKRKKVVIIVIIFIIISIYGCILNACTLIFF